MNIDPRGIINLSGKQRLPVILQSETAECGLACVAMVSTFFGRQEDLVSLRQRFGLSTRGATLNRIVKVAAQVGLASRALRCEVPELRSLSLPAIIHWNFNHFVVLRAAGRKRITIHDPAVGVRTYSTDEAGRHFTGIALELSPADGFEPAAIGPRPGLMQSLGGLRSLIPSLAQILLLSAILQIVALATPFYMQLVVDEVLVKHDADLLTLLGAGFLGLTLFSVLTKALRGWAGLYLTNQLSFNLGARLFHHLLSLPAQFFVKRQMGDIVSRFGSLRPIQDFLTTSTITVLLDGVMAITTVTMMYLYSPMLASIVLMFLAGYLVSRLLFYHPMKQRNHESIATDARADSNFMESVRAIDAIKRFAVEPQRSSEWQNRFADSINANVRVGRLSLGLDVIENGLSGVGNVLVIFMGAKEVLAGNMSIGMLYAFLSYRSHLSSAVTSLVQEFIRYLMLSLHLERLADIQLAEPENAGEGSLALPIDGRLGIRKGGFRYSADDPWVFRDLSVELAAGGSLAIFGPSGCGKSTLLGAMQQMLRLDEGELLVDGRPLPQLGVATLRQNSASVMQGDSLLAGSIQSNITFGETWPDPERMQRAAKIACIHDDIMQLPMAYESLVGEMGTSLSAGQVQRVLIARALYREPRILFLDEGTAHLDKETEFKVMRSLLELDMTCIFVTHSKAMLPLADKVLLMSQQGCCIRRARAA